MIRTEDTQVHLDPGPGALVYSHKELEKPEDTEAVLLSHAHTDHYNDVEAVIEMMTELNGKPGFLFANRTSLEGYSDYGKVISDHHQNLCSNVEVLKEGKEHEFKDLRISSQQMFHTEPKTQGLKIENQERSVGFWTDTSYSEELLDFYSGCGTLVINALVGKDTRSSKHTSVRDAVEIVEELNPKTAILTHFGSRLLENLEENKEWVDEKTDQKIIWAEDNMEFPGNRSLGDF